jgi:hypothetical protein
MKNRGLYGASQGNERVPSAVAEQNHFADNTLIEGDAVATMKNHIASKNWGKVTELTEKLKAQGYSATRINVIINQASFGVKL